MSPDQRQGARARLAALEQKATSPEDLTALAQGYLLLDGSLPEAGQEAIRVASRLQELSPERSGGYTLAASGYHQMGDYPAATEWARKALERNPHDDAAIAVFLLSAGRTRRGKAVSDAAAAPLPPASEWIAEEETASPQAQEFMSKAIKAREADDFEKTMQFSQAAMRADPSSRSVQEFYLLAADDHAQQADIAGYLAQASKAMRAGNRTEAVEWARKAALRSGNPKDLESFASFEKKAAELPAQKAAAGVPNRKEPKKNGVPIWPIGAGLGFAAIGYGVYKAKQAYASDEGLDPSPEVPPGQARRNYRLSAIGVGALLVAVAAWEFGPAVLTAVRAVLATMGPGGPGMTSELVGAGTAGGAESALVVGEASVSAVNAAALAGGAYAGAKAWSQVQSGPDLPGLFLAKGKGDDKRTDHSHGIYEDSPKHGSSGRSGPHGNISKAPQNPQEVLDDSIQIKATSKRRVGIDYRTEELNVFSETESGKWHGFSMRWEELSAEAKNALIRAGKVTRRGRIIKP